MIPPELVRAYKIQLLKASEDTLNSFCSTLATHGGYLPRKDARYVIPALAVAIAWNMQLAQLVEELPPASAGDRSAKVSRQRASKADLGAVATAAEKALCSGTGDTGILGIRCWIVGDTSAQAPTARSTYDELLQLAHQVTKAPLPKATAQAHVPALHIKTVLPGMSPEQVHSALLAAMRAVQAGLHAEQAAAPAVQVHDPAAAAAAAAAAAKVAAAAAGAAGAAGAPVSAAPEQEPDPVPEWGLDDTGRHLSSFERYLQGLDQPCDWASTGSSAGSATLLGALLHALKLTQPWTDATADLAADDTTWNTITANSNNTNSSSSSNLQQGRALVQGSSTLKVIWPDVLSAVRQGRLRQPPAGTWPFTLECYVNGKAYNTLEAYQGKGSSCFVYAVTLEPPRKVAIKRYNDNVSLHQVDQEVSALQLVTSSRCRFVMGLEGVGLCCKPQRHLMVGLVLPLAGVTLWKRVQSEGRVSVEGRLRALLFQVLLGVYELHYHRIWHRDLSPGNWMYTTSQPFPPFSFEGEQLLLTDLGASKMVDKLQTCQPLSVVHTPGFGAPEYVGAPLAGRGRNSSRSGSEQAHRHIMPGSSSSWPMADMWSVGAIALYLWCGIVPVWLKEDRPMTPSDVRAVVVERCIETGRRQGMQAASQSSSSRSAVADAEDDNSVADWVPPEGLLQLVCGCLLLDPTHRKTSQQLLLLPWFNPERDRMLTTKKEQGHSYAHPAESGADAAAPWGPALDALMQSWSIV